MSIIELKEITKAHGSKVVLDKFSLKINEGDMIAIMGASGKGKTTILNILGLIEKYDSGDYLLDGENNIKINSTKTTKILREKISYLFQNFALIEDETVYYNLNLALKYVKTNKVEKALMIKEALEKVGLPNIEKSKIYELSGGEQQRIALARIILKPCKIILADEPTGSLDEENAKLVVNLLKDLNNNGKTIIIVTHDDAVAKECNSIVQL